MVSEGIPIKDTGFFSKLITDYLNQVPEMKAFYHRFPEIDAFESQIREKQNSFDPENREILHAVLQDQYRDFEMSEATSSNLEAIAAPNTFTVVTGHQLNLFTGPLYFHYKILTTVILCHQLAKRYPQHRFVPVYWMASEDHDFDEINHFNFKGKTFRWNREAQGAVGRLITDGLEEVYDAFSSELGQGKHADFLKTLFKRAYLEHKDLSTATRFLVNALFGSSGLVILDADDSRLKAKFLPFIKDDVFKNLAFSKVTSSIEAIQKVYPGYSAQVNPREINLFYLDQGVRSRLVHESGVFRVLDTQLQFSVKELETLMDAHPERFSPNVITRPLYQEVILPNLCYVGGAGEIAYWLELKSYFEGSGVPFPILLLRNSAVLRSQKQRTKAEGLGVGIRELFLEQNLLVNKKIREISNIDINLDPQRNQLKSQFQHLYTLAAETDASFLGAVQAQEKKQLKGLDNLEQRLLLAQKRKLKDQVARLIALHNDLFPGGSLQERKCNFAEFYLETGPLWIEQLGECFDPLGLEFSVITY
ncbi:bacillithiol biosynthesis cysteine-adding enzyme BshC [Robiginitalea sp.]|nr:bacillithiol biosynthesis cysteine-adding enzyme BshC [Robiginitalea sp.]